MNKFNVGDIVSMKLLKGEEHYYMVVDVTDLTKKGEEAKGRSVDYDIVIIYPVERNPVVETMIHEELELQAKFESKEYDLIMQYVTRKRGNLGLPTLPEPIQRIVMSDNSNVVKAVKKPVKKRAEKKFGMKEINAIMQDTKGEERVELYVERMDIHLGLLYEAIKNEDVEQIEFHKEQLEKVRQTLMMLEYFPLEKRR